MDAAELNLFRSSLPSTGFVNSVSCVNSLCSNGGDVERVSGDGCEVSDDGSRAGLGPVYAEERSESKLSQLRCRPGSSPQGADGASPSARAYVVDPVAVLRANNIPSQSRIRSEPRDELFFERDVAKEGVIVDEVVPHGCLIVDHNDLPCIAIVGLSGVVSLDCCEHASVLVPARISGVFPITIDQSPRDALIATPTDFVTRITVRSTTEWSAATRRGDSGRGDRRARSNSS